MSDKLTAMTDNGTIELPLGRGTQRLGSGRDCELQLAHSQVEQLALTLDYKGETLLLHNHNPYSIYLGDKPIDTGVWSAWPPGEELRMTRDVTLRFESSAKGRQKADDEDDAASQPTPGKAMSTKQMVNIGIICACAVIALIVLNSEPQQRAAKSQDTFGDLVELLQAETNDTNVVDQTAASAGSASSQPTAWQWRKALRLLQEAHVEELRMPRRNPAQAIEAYDLLLQLDFIATATQDDGSLARRIHVYASDRKEILADK